MSFQPGDIVGGRFRIGALVAINVIGRDEKCKSIQCGGSHYHCPRCGAVVSMCGHDESACDQARVLGTDDPDWVAT